MHVFEFGGKLDTGQFEIIIPDVLQIQKNSWQICLGRTFSYKNTILLSIF